MYVVSFKYPLNKHKFSEMTVQFYCSRKNSLLPLLSSGLVITASAASAPTGAENSTQL